MGSHLPRQCGIATFTSDLADALEARESDDECIVVAMNDAPTLLVVMTRGRAEMSRVVYATGGCRDGLHEERVNQNQGAESTLSFQLALLEMRMAERPVFSQVKAGVA